MALNQMREHRFQLGSGELAWYEWGERGQSAHTVLLLHATGFHARCWRQVVAALPEDQHVIAVDQLGHGQSSNQPISDWSELYHDICSFIEELDLRDILGVGHSMGGYVSLWAASDLPERFKGLILIDPVILDPIHYSEPAVYGTDPREHPTSRRRNHWQNWQEMFDAFSGRHPFSLWDKRVLRDYCEYGLKPREPDATDGFELACPPLVEASIYVNSTTKSPLHLLDRVRMPTWVVRGYERDFEAMAATGRMDFSASPTWPELASHLPNGKDFHWHELSHFIPMQEPERVAELIKSFMA